MAVSTSGVSTTNYTGYDPLGRVVASNEKVGATSYGFTYGWNLAGDLMQETYPSTPLVGFGWDYARQPTWVGGNYQSQAATYLGFINFSGFQETYRSFGALGANVWTRGYDGRGQLSSIILNNWNHSDNSPDYTAFQEFYSYGGSNNNGNLLGKWENNSPSLVAVPGNSLSATVSQSYTYDGVNRLSSFTDSSYSRTVCYDAYGNGWTTAATGVPYLPGNAPQEIGLTCPAKNATSPYSSTNNRLVGNSYDTAGNQSSFGGNTVAYDGENRVMRVTTSTGSLVDSVQYDGDGNRISKQTSAGTTTYVYDALGGLAAEYVGGVWSKDYIRLRSQFVPSGQELVATENAAGNGSPCATCFLMLDGLGNVRVVADGSGNIYARHDYLPFGEETSSTDPNRPAASGFGLVDDVTQRFTGKERDSESGLDYFGARYYGSALGRWTSPDSLNLTSSRLLNPTNTLNKYLYGGNNPLKYVDRDGEDITIFYRPAEGGSNADFGHIFIGALNQDTGKTGFLDFYPNGATDGLGRGAGAFNLGDMQDRARQLGKYATLTIQTSPEQAQKVLDLIKKLQDGGAPDYKAFSNNCTTVCEDVLHDLGLDFGDLSPYAFWADAYRKFGVDQQLGTYNARFPQVMVPTTPGREYGNPQNVGMNFASFLFQLYFYQHSNQPEPKACVSSSDSASNTTFTTCN